MNNQTCNAFTQEGKPCQNPPQPDSDFCHLHQNVSERNYAAALANTETVQQIEDDLNKVEATLRDLEARGGELRDEAKSEYMAALKRLRQYAQNAREQLTVLRGASKDALNEVWQGYHRAWKAITEGVDQIRRDTQPTA